jgi:exopolyphosphatase/pppGpp-phosphohydrolase
MRGAAVEWIRDAPAATPAEIVAVGGTASNVLKVLPGGALDGSVTRQHLLDALAVLSIEPAARASERHGINPIRARILPAGVVILDAIMERYGVRQIRVSDAGIREGTVLAVQRAGPAWRDQLVALAQGWRG